MPEIGKAWVNIVPKAEGIEKNMQDLLGGPATSAGESAGKSAGSGLVSGLKKTASVLAVGRVIKDAFDAGGDIQQSFGGLVTLYEDAADGAKSYAMAAAQAGVSANSYAEQAVSFGAALKAAYDGDTTAAMEAANTAILAMADNAAKLGTPLSTLKETYLSLARGEARLLDNLKIGYGGTRAELERLLKDAQKISGIEYDINNFADVINAIQVIQNELGVAGTAAEEAKTTLLGSANAMKASWENLLAAMMTNEGMDEAMANLTESTGYFIENVMVMFDSLAEQAPDLILGFLDILIANAPELVAGGIEMMAQLAIGLIGAIPDLIDKIPEIFNAVVEEFKEHDWKSIGIDILTEVWNGLIELWDSVASWFAEKVDSLRGTAYIDVYTIDHGTTINDSGFSHSAGHFATGLDRVPYDNFPAILHADEMVVKASLAAPLRASGFSNSASGSDNMARISGGSQPVPTQTVVKVEFTGNMAQLARVLTPHIKVEQQRVGPSLIT